MSQILIWIRTRVFLWMLHNSLHQHMKNISVKKMNSWNVETKKWGIKPVTRAAMGSAWQLKMKQHSVLHSDPKTNTFCSKNSHQYCNMTFTAHIKIRNKYSNRTRVGSFNILIILSKKKIKNWDIYKIILNLKKV